MHGIHVVISRLVFPQFEMRPGLLRLPRQPWKVYLVKYYFYSLLQYSANARTVTSSSVNFY